jgi:SAM-dependent methyltransferase
MDHATATRRFFDAIAPRYDRVFARETHELRTRMTRVLDLLGPPRDVLDLGIGTGPELHHLLDAGHRVVGLDSSPAMLALCGARARKVHCVCADLWGALPVDDQTFDAVIALFGTLAHPPSEAALGSLAAEIVRVLRPGGLFYGETPTLAWATQHPTFVDAVTGASIDVRGASPSAWRRAFGRFAVSVDEVGDELCIVARRT